MPLLKRQFKLAGTAFQDPTDSSVYLSSSVCFLSVTDSLVAAMISCPMINRKRSDNMDNNFFIMAYLEILLYKNNNTVGKKLRDSLKKSWIKILLVFLISIVEM